MSLLQRSGPAGFLRCDEFPQWPWLGSSGAEEGLVLFEGSDGAPVRWVEAECDGLCVLVCHVEGVV